MNLAGVCESSISHASGVAGGGIVFIIVFALFLFSDVAMTIYALSSVGTEGGKERVEA